jgi:hypothetical protein
MCLDAHRHPCVQRYMCVVRLTGGWAGRSVLTAMMSTNMFVSLMSEEIARLAPKARLRSKFWCVQSTVFLSFLQYFIISFVFAVAKLDTTNYSAATVQQCIICIELAIASIAHVHYFSWTEFATPVGLSLDADAAARRGSAAPKADLTATEAMQHAIAVGDVVDDLKVAFLDESPDRLPTDVRAPLLGPASPPPPPAYGLGAGAGPSRPSIGYGAATPVSVVYATSPAAYPAPPPPPAAGSGW